MGPARTTLSAVAERAGVERRTLHRHFPTEADLFEACSIHWFAANPRPDLAAWRAVRDPHRRLALALDELYAYYERTAPMLRNVLRRRARGLRPRRRRPAGLLPRRCRLLVAALRHAVAFSTWRSLTASGAGRADALALVTAMDDAA